MKFEDKVLNFMLVLANVYKAEENQDLIRTMELNDENLTEDFTALLFATNVVFNQITGRKIDVIDFTHLLNKLAVQHLMDDHQTEKGGESDA